MTIWYKDPVSFFDINNMLLFYPTSEMDYAAKLNSIMRLVLYVSIILYSLKNDMKVFTLSLVVGIIIYIMYTVEEEKEKYISDYGGASKYDDGKLDIDDDDEYANKECTKPSKENPFMNVMMNEYTENPKRKKACKLTNKVNNYIDEYFNDNLYRSVDDIYNKNASERQYYTMPATEIPNNQDEFAQWLYGNSEKTCKEGNGLKCKYFS